MTAPERARPTGGMPAGPGQALDTPGSDHPPAGRSADVGAARRLTRRAVGETAQAVAKSDPDRTRSQPGSGHRAAVWP